MAVPKPRAPAIDLAEHDIIEDDCDLVVGPLVSRASADSASTASQAPPGRQLSSSNSFKDTSILGSAALTAKLVQPVPGPATALIARRPSARDVGHCIYGGGCPIIASAAPSRPTSAALRPPRSSAPSGSGVDPAAAPPPPAAALKSTSPSTTAMTDPLPDGVARRMEGDIMGGDNDSNSPPKASGSLLRRLSGGRIRLDGGSNPKSKPAAADAPAPLAKLLPTHGADSGGGGTLGLSEGRVLGKGSALPCVDVEPERRQRLLRRASLNERQATVTATVGSAAAPPLPPKLQKAASQRSQDVEGRAGTTLQPGSDAGAAVGGTRARQVEGSDAAPAAESSAGALRLLVRMVSGAMVAPNQQPGPQQQQQQQQQQHKEEHKEQQQSRGQQSKGQEGPGQSKERRTSIGGLRELFSRPSSARRTSEAGGPQRPPSARLQQYGQPSPRTLGWVAPEGMTTTATTTAGGARPVSGFLKRTASALQLAWAH